jgi:hypothetical protein
MQLGWRPEQVMVIDSDLGESGASTVGLAAGAQLGGLAPAA